MCRCAFDIVACFFVLHFCLGDQDVIRTGCFLLATDYCDLESGERLSIWRGRAGVFTNTVPVARDSLQEHTRRSYIWAHSIHLDACLSELGIRLLVPES